MAENVKEIESLLWLANELGAKISVDISTATDHSIFFG
jgi:hypothetical protein